MIVEQPITETTPASAAPHDSARIGRKGEEIYLRIRSQVERPETIGDYLIIETATEEWEIVPYDNSDRLARRLLEKGPGVGRYMTRIGYEAFAAKGTRLARRND